MLLSIKHRQTKRKPRDPIIPVGHHVTPALKRVEYWRWRYRDVETGCISRTTVACTAEKARSRYPSAERIEGTLSVREEPSAVSSRRGVFRRPLVASTVLIRRDRISAGAMQRPASIKA
jgi:hypothetical protein